jgi:hypothetical protein
MNRGAVEKLQRAGDDLRRDDRRYSFGRGVHLPNVATIVFFACGLGIRRSSTLVMTPSVPSEPMNRSFIE